MTNALPTFITPPAPLEVTVWEMLTDIVAYEGLAIVRVHFHTTAKGNGHLTIDLEDAKAAEGKKADLTSITTATKQLSRLLDVADANEEINLGNTYTLEVGSPGLERPIMTHEDVARFVGKQVRVKTTMQQAHNGEGFESRRSFLGNLVNIADEQLHLTFENSPFSVFLADIQSIKLSPTEAEIDALMKAAKAGAKG